LETNEGVRWILGIDNPPYNIYKYKLHL